MFVSDEFLVYIHIQHSYNTQHLKRKVYCKQCKVSFAAVVARLYDPLGGRSDYGDFSSQIVTKYYFYFLVVQVPAVWTWSSSTCTFVLDVVLSRESAKEWPKARKTNISSSSSEAGQKGPFLDLWPLLDHVKEQEAKMRWQHQNMRIVCGWMKITKCFNAAISFLWDCFHSP